MKRISRILISLIFLTIVSLLALSDTHAVPNLISYQGVLNDKDGHPISSTVSMTFKIYDVATGGTALWSETQSVQVSNGLFNVKLGAVSSLPPTIFTIDSLYLGIQVASDPEMTPRQQVTSGAYAQKADFVGHGAIPIGTILAWAKSIPGVPALPYGWEECNGQTLNDTESPLNGQVIPNLNGENRFLRGNAVSGGVGGGPHNHEWVSYHATPGALIVTQSLGARNRSYDSQGNQIPIQSNLAGSHFTELKDTNPYYYNVVWIIRVK